MAETHTVIEMPGIKSWLVTRVQTVTVEAKTEDHALFMGEQLLDFFGSETENIQVEELEG